MLLLPSCEYFNLQSDSPDIVEPFQHCYLCSHRSGNFPWRSQWMRICLCAPDGILLKNHGWKRNVDGEVRQGRASLIGWGKPVTKPPCKMTFFVILHRRSKYFSTASRTDNVNSGLQIEQRESKCKSDKLEFIHKCSFLHLFNLATWHTEILLFLPPPPFGGRRGFIFNFTVMRSCIIFTWASKFQI